MSGVSDARAIERDFMDALREFLGMRPLYDDNTSRKANEKLHFDEMSESDFSLTNLGIEKTPSAISFTRAKLAETNTSRSPKLGAHIDLSALRAMLKNEHEPLRGKSHITAPTVERRSVGDRKYLR